MAKQTAAQKHTRAHLKRRVERLENRPMPNFPNSTYVGGANISIIADAHGTLYRVDVEAGTIRRLRWEQ